MPAGEFSKEIRICSGMLLAFDTAVNSCGPVCLFAYCAVGTVW